MWAIGSGFVSAQVPDDERLRTRAFGKDLRNPIGLAAGFDKNGVAIEGWEQMGLGFVEIGTVTPLPQPGNAKPRMFRLLEDEAIINRLGFNNQGVVELVNRLRSTNSRIALGVNIGKGISTPVEGAAADYASCAKRLDGFADYCVINVSSPNTPGLRSLQTTESLETIVDAVRKVTKALLFIKVSPDEEDSNLVTIAKFAAERDLGLVATNTTLSRQGLSSRNAAEAGGLSGRPLRERAEQVCRILRGAAGDSVEIIGVGGIFTGQDLANRLRAGATVCQIYSALVYRGPSAVSQILAEYLDAIRA